MWSTPLLPLISGPLSLGVVVPVSDPSMAQIEPFNHSFYMKPFNCVQMNNYYLIELLVLNSISIISIEII